MFKWKITGKKSCKQEKLNNEVINKNARNNNAKLTAGNQLLEREKRNIVISEVLPGSANVPHRVPTHPIPPETAVSSHLPQDQPLPPHATYPTHNSPYSAPPMCSPASPIYAPLPHRQHQQGATRPPPYIHPPNRPQLSSATIPTSCGPPPVAGPQQPTTASVSATASSSPYGLLPARTRQLKTSQATQAGDDSSHNTSINSSTTDNSKTEAGSASWMEWTQQLQAYVAWVNSQLRKRQGYHLVTDLRTDLHSGVVLADLVEIISSEKIAGVHRLPETAQIMRENVERVLQFMAAKRIRMHHVGSKEVVEGNLKAIMRLILALAAHYKPQSVRTSPYDSAATSTGQNPGATSASATTSGTNQASIPTTSYVRPSSRAPTTPSASLPTTPNKPTTTAPTGTPTGASTRPTNSLSACVTTPNLNVPGNRKSIGHLFETSGMSVAAPLRRFPSIAGHQWSHQWGGGVVSLAPDGDQADVNVDADQEAPGEPVPKRVGRRQWGQPGPPLYENLHRSSSFVGGYSGESRPRSQPNVQQKQQQKIREGIYDVPRTRPARIEDARDAGAEQPPMSPTVTNSDQLEDKHKKQLSVALPEDTLSSSSADDEHHHHHRREVSSSSCVQTTQTDTGGREGKEITDGYNSLPRNAIRPAALDFWESLTAIHQSPGNSSPNTSGEFRCNTIHRMSGRRKLPRIPYDSKGCDGPKSGDQMSSAASNGVRRASATEEFEERSLGSRGEVEGSSSHGSPTTSIVRTREEAVAEWLRGSPGRRSDSWTRAEVGSGGGELWRNSALRRSTQLESWGRTQATVPTNGQNGWGRTQATATASSQDSWGRTQATATAPSQDSWGRTQATATAPSQDSWGRTQATAPGRDGWGRTQATATASSQDDWGRSQSSTTGVSSPIPATPVSGARQEAAGSMSYEVLLEELAKARRQLVALQELVSLLNVDGRGGGPAEDFNFLKSQLQNTSERCDLLQQDLQQNQQGNAMSRLRAQEGEVQSLKKQLMSKDRLLQQQRLQFDDAVKAMSSNGHQVKNGQHVPTLDARLQNREEVNILREALHSLRISLKESDSNHHTLDTLEQCVAIVLERLIALENGRQGEMMAPLSPNKRAPISSFHGNSAYTKVVYYTEKTATPYLSSISKQLGEITLRDFKLVFDRAGSFRFHFKSMDPEFGMVKEEIASDDEILPGFDGKLIAWVQEDHGV